MNTQLKKEDLEGFHEASQSLKLYRRAELQDLSGRSLIKELYVDPLPEEHVFQTLLKPNTTFVIGRKGTGKSTIFQRTQEELQIIRACTSAYIDIKTIYESSQVEVVNYDLNKSSLASLPNESIQRLLLYRSFLTAVIREIKSQIEKRINTSLIERLKEKFMGSIAELFEDLDELLEDANSDDYLNITGAKQIDHSIVDKASGETELQGKIETKIKAVPEIDSTLLGKLSNELESGEEIKYSEILLRIFNISELLKRLKTLLGNLGIKHLYIFVDDFSELPEKAMRIVVDTLLAPMNNWSDELIKLKIAAYPGRVYYGSIDKTKIDEIYLDIYKAYGSTDVSAMEDKAVDFTKRLILKRLRYYCNADPSIFFESNIDEIWLILFYASMGNPRIIGYLLFFLYESHLLYGSPIGIKAIKDAARRYYEDKIEAYFAMNKFLHESFEERSSIFSLKELLEYIVIRAKELRSYRDSAIMKAIKGRPPTSHFHVPVNFDSILSTLELNFFITKYYEMSNRDGIKVSIYALNYGLCQKHSIEFGRPREKREHRVYFIERIFDYTSILSNYIKMNQEIVCDKCGEKYEIDKFDALKLYNMQCPKCSKGICKIVNLSRKYESFLNSISPELLLPETELGMLHTLHLEKRAMFPIEIAAELDCSYQLIGKRGKFLSQKSLVDRDKNQQGRREYKIRPETEQIYFGEKSQDELDVGED